MANPIATRQNEQYFQDLFFAQARFYTVAKRWSLLRLVISLLPVAIGVAAYYLQWTDAFKEPILVGCSVVSIFSTIYLKRIDSPLAEKGAKIQEQIDTELFEIPWSECLSDEKVDKEDIIQAKKNYSGEPKRFINWYDGIDPSHPTTRAALICQKSNLTWDARQRKTFKYFFAVMGWLAVLAPTVYFLYQNWPMAGYLKQALLPMASFIILCFENYNTHKEVSDQQNKLSGQIQKVLQGQNEEITVDFLRKTQNAIYKRRKDSTAMIPDWFYKLLRPVLNRLITEANQQR
jgi:SMODS-associating 4TM effector domain